MSIEAVSESFEALEIIETQPNWSDDLFEWVNTWSPTSTFTAVNATPINTRLFDAIIDYRNDLVAHLVECERIDLSDPWLLDEDCDTPLLTAIYTQNWEAMQILLDNGANPDRPNPEGKLPILLTIARNDKKAAALLVRAGAALNEVYVSGRQESCLHYATYTGNAEMVKFFLSHGADPNARDEDGETPLMAAISLDYTVIASLLLQWGGDPTIPNHHGFTPLEYAWGLGREEIYNAMSRD